MFSLLIFTLSVFLIVLNLTKLLLKLLEKHKDYQYEENNYQNTERWRQSEEITKVKEQIQQALRNKEEYLSLSLHGDVTIPSEIGELIQLKSLHIQHADRVVLPKSFGQLENLETLTITAQHSISIPQEIKNLHSLKHFICHSNMTLPREFHTLTGLETLSLCGNSNTLYLELHNFPKITKLTLDGDLLTNRVSTQIASLQHLETLTIGGNNLTSFTLKNSEHLKLLKLRTSHNLKELGLVNLPRLEEISLTDTYHYSIESLTLHNLPKLETLPLSPLTGLENISLEELPTIQHLTLSHEAPTPPNLHQALNGLETLTSLTLQNVQVHHLDRFTYIQNLTLQNYKNISFLNIAGFPPNLKSLYFTGYANNFPHLPKTMGLLQKLERLTIRNPDLIPSSTDLQDLNNLKYLEINDCQSNKLLPALHNLPNLQELHLNGIPPFSGNTWTDNTLPSLKKLRINNISSLDYFTGIHTLESLEDLELNISSISKLPSEIFMLQQLKKITISTSQPLELPDNMHQLTSCEAVEWSSKEEIPTALVKLPQLKHLTINAPIPSIPTNLHDIKQLESLRLQFPDATQAKLDQLSAFTQLKALHISGYACTIDLSDIHQFSNQLERISLYNIKAINTSALQESLSNLKNLHTLCIEACHGASIPLRLEGNYPFAEKLTELTFHFDGNAEELAFLSKFPNIQSLTIYGTAALTEIPTSILQMRKLEELLFMHTNIKAIPDELIQIQTLEDLYINGNSDWDAPTVQYIPEQIMDHPNLAEISIGGDSDMIYDYIDNIPSTLFRDFLYRFVNVDNNQYD